MNSTIARCLAKAPIGVRGIHGAAKKAVPAPRGDIQDPSAFLTKIGRNSASLADKFKSWEHLFTATPAEMKADMSLSVKQRRWILNWTEKYRQGIDPYVIPTKPVKKKTK
ncbi:IGR protein motif-domain-containing protein [Linnemannia elongata]|nr:hypothetical protein BGZ88_004196 [Linnemannia elongata]KAG0070300.1 hypothetical protein BGZ89_000924 [Linnemannia elongata]KAH7043469.1 IGR protein motif-domain-containing protein [Linnemannia elongata]